MIKAKLASHNALKTRSVQWLTSPVDQGDSEIDRHTVGVVIALAMPKPTTVAL
jgi:hypothetical protein